KMESPVKAHKSGVVTGLDVEEGKQVNKNDVLFEIK
ncbi:biotin/lipoyl-containing protein, partial [Corynebacterium sp.]